MTGSASSGISAPASTRATSGAAAARTPSGPDRASASSRCPRIAVAGVAREEPRRREERGLVVRVVEERHDSSSVQRSIQRGKGGTAYRRLW